MRRVGGDRAWLRWALATLASLVIAGAAAPIGALAQTAEAFPSARAIDVNGVDLVSGALALHTRDVSIGQAGAGGLEYDRTLSVSGSTGTTPNLIWRSNLDAGISTPDNVNYTVVVGAITDNFTLSSGVYTSLQGMGSSLTYNSSTGVYTYIARDGTVATFSTATLAKVQFADLSALVASVTSITAPNGEVQTFTYKTVNLCASGGGSCANYSRLQSVTNNHGYQLKLAYSLNTPSTNADAPAWQQLSSVTAINNAIDYCDPTADSCTGLTTTWPSASYSISTTSGLVISTTDALSRTTTFSMAQENGATQWNGSPMMYMVGIQRPLSTTNPTTVTYNTSNKVASVTNGVGTWSYSYATSSGNETTTVTDPLSHVTTIVSSVSTGLVSSVTDPLSRTTSYTYDSSGRLTQVTRPEGDELQLAYDARGNVTTTTLVPKSGSGLSNIVASASFDTTCTYIAKCNRPNSTTDPRSNTTSYTYDNTTGNVLTATLPAATTGAVQPQTRFTYSSLYAYLKNSSGTIVAAASPISLLTATSTCATTASCSGTSDEVKTTVTYGSTGVANNLLPTSIASGAGDGSLTATTVTTYDVIGNKATVTPPLGSSETTAYVFDADRELIGVMGPTPGETGLNNPATRNTYNADGLVTLSEVGTVTAQTTTAFASFSTLEQTATSYDVLDRKTAVSRTSGGVTLALTNFSYDAANRLTCAARRINASSFGSEPSSACTLGTPVGAANDRITANTYDAANQLTVVTVAYGTPLQAAYKTQTFSNDGLVKTILDANNNLTTYTYDGFNRLSQTAFPVATLGANSSSTTDVEGLTYDAGSNVLTDTKRDGSVLTFTYDALNRVTQKAPSFGGTTVNYAYDLLNRQTSALYASSGTGVTYAYDALSRITAETTDGLALGYQHDLANNTTQITWPDGFYATYTYDNLNRMEMMQDSSGGLTGAYITYSFDNTGRRTGLARGNSTSTSYSYDGLNRLTNLAQSLSGTNSVSFYETYSPLSQITSLGLTNTTYVSHPAATATSYTTNGRNQYTSVGSASFTYDGRANLTSDGTRTFTYDLENRLLSESGGPQNITLSYDPTGRLNETVGSATTQFLYAGSRLVAEYNGSGTVLRRYVPGANADEPALWYEGSAYTDRRWLHADNKGSIIAYSDGTGATGATYGYGPYGEPNAWAGSRFRYTGQIEIPEAQLYYYKARVYDPTLGRFLQTDPVGYASDVNPYAYTGNDPVNLSDPSGMDVTVVGHVYTTRDSCDVDFGCSDISYDQAFGPGGEVPVNGGPSFATPPSDDPSKPKQPQCSSGSDAPCVVVVAPPRPPNPPPANAIPISALSPFLQNPFNRLNPFGQEFSPGDIFSGRTCDQAADALSSASARLDFDSETLIELESASPSDLPGVSPAVGAAILKADIAAQIGIVSADGAAVKLAQERLDHCVN